MQNAAAEGETCLPCPTNAICRGGCKDNPSATLCSDPLYEPRDITSLGDVYREAMLGGLTWIPKAMPYPVAGYLQLLDEAFTGEAPGAPGLICAESGLCGDCPRFGAGACWWPLLHTATGDGLPVFTMSGNIIVTNEQVTHNGQDWPKPWWSQNYDLASPYIGASPFECSIPLLPLSRLRNWSRRAQRAEWPQM